MANLDLCPVVMILVLVDSLLSPTGIGHIRTPYGGTKYIEMPRERRRKKCPGGAPERLDEVLVSPGTSELLERRKEERRARRKKKLLSYLHAPTGKLAGRVPLTKKRLELSLNSVPLSELGRRRKRRRWFTKTMSYP